MNGPLKTVPSVCVSYPVNGSSTTSNEMGMRAMQDRAYEMQGQQYLLIKSPPASEQSRALIIIALFKLIDMYTKLTSKVSA